MTKKTPAAAPAKRRPPSGYTAKFSGPFAIAHYRVFGDATAAASYLRPLADHVNDHGIGNISEIFDGDPPHTPRGCPAQAWSVATALRAWRKLHPAPNAETVAAPPVRES